MTDETTRLNRDFLGKEYQAGPQTVDSESVRKYALATNEKNPLYLNEASEPIPSPLYPVVFLPDILSQLVDDSEKIDFNILRVVHAEHQISWREPLRIGDEIHTTAKISNMEKRGVNEILDLQIQCRRGDVSVVEMNYRLLSRGKKKEGEKKPVKDTPEPERGEALVRHESIVTADQGKRYAEASGDHNPIHISDEAARSVGLPRSILHGLCTMALSSQAIVDRLLEGNPKRLKSMSVRFSRPVLLDQTLTTEVYEGGLSKEGLHVVQFETRDEKGTPVLIHGTAEYSD
jgi:acyl dehydratase